MSKYQVGETYYQDFNTLYDETPYEWEWKCIAKSESGEPVFERIKPEPDSIINPRFIVALSELGLGNELYTKEEMDKKWAEERDLVEAGLKDQQGILEFMIKAIESYIRNDEYGYTFTTEEKKQFPKRLKEEFGLDINMELE